MASNKILVNFRLTPEAKGMLERLTAYRGGSQAILVEQLIRSAFYAEEKDIERYERKKERQ